MGKDARPGWLDSLGFYAQQTLLFAGVLFLIAALALLSAALTPHDNEAAAREAMRRPVCQSCFLRYGEPHP